MNPEVREERQRWRERKRDQKKKRKANRIAKESDEKSRTQKAIRRKESKAKEEIGKEGSANLRNTAACLGWGELDIFCFYQINQFSNEKAKLN